MRSIFLLLILLGFAAPASEAQDRGARFCGNLNRPRVQTPTPRDLRKEAKVAQDQFNYEIEKRLTKRINEFKFDDKNQAAKGARSILELASFYKNTDRFTEAVQQYERAIAILQNLPEEKLMLQNAELSKQSVQERVRKTIEFLSKRPIVKNK